jgi:hypothetical protein
LIAADTSSLVAFLAGQEGPDTHAMAEALAQDQLCLPPPVLAELRSFPNFAPAHALIIGQAPLIPLTDGFWLRAGDSRRLLLQKGLKARLADTLIAQCCIDAAAPLITRDSDFRHFALWCGLKLAI